MLTLAAALPRRYACFQVGLLFMIFSRNCGDLQYRPLQACRFARIGAKACLNAAKSRCRAQVKHTNGSVQASHLRGPLRLVDRNLLHFERPRQTRSCPSLPTCDQYSLLHWLSQDVAIYYARSPWVTAPRWSRLVGCWILSVRKHPYLL